MIARRFQQTIITSVYQCMQRTFRPVQKFLDYNPPACLAEPALIHHLIDSRSCGGSVRSNGYPFTEGKAVRFDHNGKFQSLAVTKRFAAIGECPRFGCRDFLRAHQFFRENFGGLNASRRLSRTKRTQFLSSEKIDNPRGKRIVRTDDRQIDTITFGETNKRLQVIGGNRDILGNFGGTGVSRRAENPLRMRRLPQFPCKRVFTAATANDQNFHRSKYRNRLDCAANSQARGSRYLSGCDSAGKIGNSNFSVCRMTVSLALTPI